MSRGGGVLSHDQFSRRLAWLAEAVRGVPGPRVEREALGALWLEFDVPAEAERFRAGLVAEGMPAEVDGRRVTLHVQQWYSPADLRALALAVAKVAHYLGFAG